jgi:hypothetical protein
VSGPLSFMPSLCSAVSPIALRADATLGGPRCACAREDHHRLPGYRFCRRALRHSSRLLLPGNYIAIVITENGRSRAAVQPHGKPVDIWSVSFLIVCFCGLHVRARRL